MNNFIGNDIVDLTQMGVLEKYRETRFIKRVLSNIEINYLENSIRPDLLLWYLWSAKEAAFKVMKKYDQDIVFAHRKFIIELKKFELQSVFDKRNFNAILKYGKNKLKVEWLTNANYKWIHCNATLVRSDADKDFDVFDYKVMETANVLDRSRFFTDEERLSIYSKQSKAVRVLVKTLLYQNGLEGAQIIRHPLGKRFAPPMIYKNSIKLENWDLSMTHDGDFVACSIIKPR